MRQVRGSLRKIEFYYFYRTINSSNYDFSHTDISRVATLVRSVPRRWCAGSTGFAAGVSDPGGHRRVGSTSLVGFSGRRRCRCPGNWQRRGCWSSTISEFLSSLGEALRGQYALGGRPGGERCRQPAQIGLRRPDAVLLDAMPMDGPSVGASSQPETAHVAVMAMSVGDPTNWSHASSARAACFIVNHSRRWYPRAVEAGALSSREPAEP